MKTEILHQDTDRLEAGLAGARKLLPCGQSIIDSYQSEKSPAMPAMDNDLFFRLIRGQVDLLKLFWDSVEAPKLPDGTSLRKDSLNIAVPDFVGTYSAVELYKDQQRKLVTGGARSNVGIIINNDGNAGLNADKVQALADKCTIYLDSTEKKELAEKLRLIADTISEIQQITGLNNLNVPGWEHFVRNKDILPMFRQILSQAGINCFGRAPVEHVATVED